LPLPSGVIVDMPGTATDISQGGLRVICGVHEKVTIRIPISDGTLAEVPVAESSRASEGLHSICSRFLRSGRKADVTTSPDHDRSAIVAWSREIEVPYPNTDPGARGNYEQLGARTMYEIGLQYRARTWSDDE
jgi:hypothetical protein